MIDNVVPGGIITVDNVISHEDELTDFVSLVENDPRVDALVVPIGKGILVCRKIL